MHARHTGRFAPSPTGPLHFGSLIAAVGSHAAARAVGGTWLLRIDDLDPPREVPGAAGDILRTLECYGLHWDGKVHYQSQCQHLYADAYTQLHNQGVTYRCCCSRRQLAEQAASGPLGRIYPGTCRDRRTAAEEPAATRLRLPPGPLAIADAVQGHYQRDTADIGDVVIRRRDGHWAYHLATTIDDAEMGVTHVVRGVDLLPAGLVQTALERMLDLPAPAWMHLPVVRSPQGDKLSKQTGARALPLDDPVAWLLQAWAFLGQSPPSARPETVAEFHAHAARHWTPKTIPAENSDGSVTLGNGLW